MTTEVIIADEQKIKNIWKQDSIPVVLRRSVKGEGIRARLPFLKDNRQWLQNGRRNKPFWNKTGRYWEFPKAWFNDFVDRSLHRWGKVYIIQPYRERETCDRRCMNAQGHECQCSCMGANHGQGDDSSWFFTSDTFAVRWKEQELACRLMEKKF